MSSVFLTVQQLLKEAGPLAAMVGTRIYSGAVPQGVANKSIAVYLVSQAEEELLQGATRWPEGRVSVECRAVEYGDADLIGEAVINWLRDKDRVSIVLTGIGTYEASFRKEGSDETDQSDESQQGQPLYSRRIIDFYVRWRRIG